MINDWLRQQKAERIQRGLYRQAVLATADVYPLNFSSNDYLSLRRDERVQRAYQQGFARYDGGSGGSMQVCGYQPVHQDLEQAVAQQLGVDKALLFSSGYAANLGIVSMLAGLGCHFLIDKGVHASVYDGLALSGANYRRYHQDLHKKIAGQKSGQVLISEGIFSMGGRQPDFGEIAEVCAAHETVCVIDEAHSFGVLGPSGMGAAAQYALSQEQVPLRMIAFGKAMGGQGAVVAGQAEWVDALYQHARSFVYSTAMSPALAYGLLASFRLLCEADDARRTLRDLIAYFQQITAGLPFRPSHTPIQQLRLGCPHRAQALALALGKQGILCQAIREPTVPRVDNGLRIVLNAHHQPEDLERLLALIKANLQNED